MDLGLSGKRALVTGSTGGIGFAIAQGLAAEGADVVIAGRTPGSVDGALARLKVAVRSAKIRRPAPSVRRRARARHPGEQVNQIM